MHLDRMLSLTSDLNQNHFVFRLDDSMVNVCVYGIAMAADASANRRKHSPNIFWS